MKNLLFIIFLIFSSSPSIADHGPFSLEDKLDNHQLHIGIAETTNPNGELKRFGIRACTTKELDFVNPWRSAQKGTTPFKLKTEEIVAFGLAGTINSGFNTGNAATRTIGAITNPISLPLSIFSKGNRKNFQYSILTINRENGRIAQRGINLYSQKDIKYLNDYLNLSTGYNPSEQLTSEELGRKYLVLKQKEVLPSIISCDYMEKYGQIRSKKSRSTNSTKTSIRVNCNSPVWKKRPECN